MALIAAIMLIIVLGVATYRYILNLKRYQQAYTEQMAKRVALLEQENLKVSHQLANCRDEQERTKRTAERDWEFMQEIIVNAERKRIATDLHDDTVQKITIARLRLINATLKDLNSPLKEEISIVSKQLELIINNLRFLIDNDLQPEYKVNDLAKLLKDLSDDYDTVWLNKQVVFRIYNTDKQFHIDERITRELYYLAHETVVNAIKNSIAAEVQIILDWHNGLTLTIKDDGQSRIIAKSGTGTKNLTARAEKIGAALEHINTPYGYTLIIRLARPLSNQTV